MVPSARVVKAELTSVPLRSTRRLPDEETEGILTSTRADPPLTKSARLESVLTVVPPGGELLPPHAASASEKAAASAATRSCLIFKKVSCGLAGLRRRVVQTQAMTNPHERAYSQHCTTVIRVNR